MKRSEYLFLFAVVACFFLVGCTSTDTKQTDTIASIFAAVGTAVSAIPGVGPILGPALTAAAPAISSLFTSNTASAVVGAAALQHVQFGLPMTKRRKLLSPARTAHIAAKAAAHAAAKAATA